MVWLQIPSLCPWKAWPGLQLPPRDEWLHSGPGRAVGGFFCFTDWWLGVVEQLPADRYWSDSAGDGQDWEADAASTDSCRKWGATFKHTDPLQKIHSWEFPAADLPLKPNFHSFNSSRTLQLECIIKGAWTPTPLRYSAGKSLHRASSFTKLVLSQLDSLFTSKHRIFHLIPAPDWPLPPTQGSHKS